MILKDYLMKLLLDEKAIVEELIKIDNKVQSSNITYKNVIDELNDCEIVNTGNLEVNYDFIIDGEINTIIYVLLNYSTCIRYLHINSKNVGLASWIISRIKEYYEEQGIITLLSLDINKDYKAFTEDSVLVLCGFKEFVDGMSLLFEDKKFIKMEV